MNNKQVSIIVLASISLQTYSHAADNFNISSIENNLLPKVQVIGRNYQAKTIKQRMTHYKVPGVSVAVIKDNKLAWAKGYGLANKQTSHKVTTTTLFQAGSISKPIAALAALKLVQQQKIDLDSNINNYLKSWQIPSSAFTKENPVTLRHILSHTGGLTVHGFPGYQRGESLPSNAAVLSGEGNTATVEVDAQPGKQWRYSGGGYTVMEQVVEDISRMTFDNYLHQEVLLPLKMKNSTFEQPLSKTKWLQASAAFDRQGEQITGDWHNYPEQAAAGLWTTPSDLANYVLAVQNARAGNNKQMLTPETVNKMLTSHQGSWGLGPSLANNSQGLVFGHGGKNAGFTNDLVAYADSGNAIIIMSNGDNANPLISELKIAISTHYGWDLAEPIQLKPTKLTKDITNSFTGKYRYDRQSDYEINISFTDRKIFVYDPDTDSQLEFVATSKQGIQNLASGSKIDFITNEQGIVTNLTWAGSHHFTKLGDTSE